MSFRTALAVRNLLLASIGNSSTSGGGRRRCESQRYCATSMASAMRSSADSIRSSSFCAASFHSRNFCGASFTRPTSHPRASMPRSLSASRPRPPSPKTAAGSSHLLLLSSPMPISRARFVPHLFRPQIAQKSCEIGRPGVTCLSPVVQSPPWPEVQSRRSRPFVPAKTVPKSKARKTSKKAPKPQKTAPKKSSSKPGASLTFNHAMIYARDVERSLRFYRDLLGFKLIEDFQFEGKPVYARLRAPSGEGTIALHQLGPGASTVADGVRLYQIGRA